jgi:hypothetical protein
LNVKSQSSTPSLSEIERKAKERLLELYLEQALAEMVDGIEILSREEFVRKPSNIINPNSVHPACGLQSPSSCP